MDPIYVGDRGVKAEITIPSDTQSKKREYLNLFPTIGTVSATARAIGLTLGDILEWRISDPVFLEQCHMAEDIFLQDFEAEHIASARNHKYERSADFMANISVLAARKPEYRSNTKVTISAEKTVVTSVEDMLGKARKAQDASD